MGRNKNFNIAEELVKALHDERVRAIFGEIFDERVKALIEKVEFLDKENQRKTVEINQLKSELATATQKVNELESYNRRENLIITGLPAVN